MRNKDISILALISNNRLIKVISFLKTDLRPISFPERAFSYSYQVEKYWAWKSCNVSHSNYFSNNFESCLIYFSKYYFVEYVTSIFRNHFSVRISFTVFKSRTIRSLRKVTYDLRHLAKLEKRKSSEQPGLPDFWQMFGGSTERKLEFHSEIKDKSWWSRLDNPS